MTSPFFVRVTLENYKVYPPEQQEVLRRHLSPRPDFVQEPGEGASALPSYIKPGYLDLGQSATEFVADLAALYNDCPGLPLKVVGHYHTDTPLPRFIRWKPGTPLTVPCVVDDDALEDGTPRFSIRFGPTAFWTVAENCAAHPEALKWALLSTTARRMHELEQRAKGSDLEPWRSTLRPLKQAMLTASPRQRAHMLALIVDYLT